MRQLKVIVLCKLCLSICLYPISTFAGMIDCSKYTAIPPFLSNEVTPSTTIILDNSGSMFEHAYQERHVYWNYDDTNSSGDRRAYAGYNSTYEYYGYFDPYSNYDYHKDGENGYFYKSTTGQWNGNFLNWITMHRIDIARKVLTGGKYEVINGEYFLRIELTDGYDSRGQYHVYNDTEAHTGLNGNATYMTPFRTSIGIAQWAGQYFFEIYQVKTIEHYGEGATAQERWHISPATNTFGRFYLRIKVDEEPRGVLDNIAGRMRLSLFVFDNDGDYDTGAEIRKYMGAPLAEIKKAINSELPATCSELPATWTPLAEALYTVIGYIQQSDSNSDGNGPHYEDDSYNLDNNNHDYPDPYYFSDRNELIYCTRQNVIIITDGESTMDLNIPSAYQDYDGDNNDPGAYASSGSDFLDDIALWAHTTDLRSDLQGIQSIDLYTLFAFGSGSQLLKDAAKNGGFVDRNGNNLPDLQEEWDQDHDGVPDNYFEAMSGRELETTLNRTFSKILERMSSGSAASVISSDRSGAGAIFQAVFWPKKYDAYGNEVTWVGDVHAFLINDAGVLYEDSNLNQGLDDEDKQIALFYDQHEGRTRVCVGGNVSNDVCNGTVKEIDEIKFLWSAANWLNSRNESYLATNRSPYTDFTSNQRYIFTWMDLDNDGVIDSGEVVDFEEANANLFDLDGDGRSDINATVINWIRGIEQNGTRSRYLRYDYDLDNNDEEAVWRLGDVIYSSPVVVGAPAENYDLYWGDTSYSTFYKKYKNRRTMVYFGANDGMLHAINSGFYKSDEKKFYRHYDSSSSTYTNNGPELGAEMWAYIPYNLLPHLECLLDPAYEHKYYVDLKPRVFDVKIFNNDETHPGGWGTILVGGMRFGGSAGDTRVELGNRAFISSYFILDITDPESPPTLLGEFTASPETSTGSGSAASATASASGPLLDIGFTLFSPVVVPLKHATGFKWYLVIGTGPQSLDGTGKPAPAIVVLPLDEYLVNHPEKSLRLPDLQQTPGETQLGCITEGLGSGAAGVSVSDFVAVDYNFDFFTDCFYFGTVENDNQGDLSGTLQRLNMFDEGNQDALYLDAGQWQLRTLYQSPGPISSAPNIGWQGGNLWVYFGTGRFWTVEDKLDTSEQWIYGLKDPYFTETNLSSGTPNNWTIIVDANIVDLTDIVLDNSTLLLKCLDGSTDCFSQFRSNEGAPETFQDLVDYLLQDVDSTGQNNIDGWRRKLLQCIGERVVGQPTLLGGLVNITSYCPGDDLCQSEGESFLYSLYYLTGSSWTKNVFGDEDEDYIEFVRSIGPGLSPTPTLQMGRNKPPQVFLPTSPGYIEQLPIENLPLDNIHSGRSSWHTFDVD